MIFDCSKIPATQSPSEVVKSHYRVLAVDLSTLTLSKEEAAILKGMQKKFLMFKLYEYHSPEHRNKEQREIIRGMKYAFDEIQTTDDGFTQSLDWQATLY